MLGTGAIRALKVVLHAVTIPPVLSVKKAVNYSNVRVGIWSVF